MYKRNARFRRLLHLHSPWMTPSEIDAQIHMFRSSSIQPDHKEYLAEEYYGVFSRRKSVRRHSKVDIEEEAYREND